MDKYFGRRYSSAAYLDATHVATPVGEHCAHCDELIAAGDDGWLVPILRVNDCERDGAYHRACFLRGIIGSVAHQQRRCLCFVPGSTLEDDPALTPRQAAAAALDYYENTAPGKKS